MRSLQRAVARAPRLLALLVGLALLAPAPVLLATSAQADPRPGYIEGTVSDYEGTELDGVTVTVQTLAGATVATGTSQTVADPADPTAVTKGFYSVPVQPGSYQLRFDRAGYDSAYLLNDDDERATVVVDGAGTVSAAGVDQDDDRWLADVSLLLPAPSPGQKPDLGGTPAVGETLTLSTGTWPGIDVDTDYITVEWFIGNDEADDYSDGAWWQKFTVPLEAVGSRVSYRMTVEDSEGAHAAATYTGSSAVVAKPASTVTATLKKSKLTVLVTVDGVPKPSGTITVVDGKKSVGKTTLRERSKGKATVKIARLKPGRHKLTVTYTGPAEIQSSKTTVKVKIAKK
jgi:hypothetical protein